ncbi:ABC transporter permease [Clostridium sp. LP20]|uniref:ABC transporter permease n=1 Tax=Clostridium sp. LP20 TaxID=3418665 RepID=UPI003EE53F67
MINIMKNVSKILLKRKSFILISFLLPIALIYMFTMLYGGNSTFKIAVFNRDNGELGNAIEERLGVMNAVDIIDIEDNDSYKEKLIFHEVEMIITIDENFTESLTNGEKNEIKIKSVSKSDMEAAITGVLESETKELARLCNNVNIKEVGLANVISDFKELKPSYEIRNTGDVKQSINNSVGIIIYLIFICAGISCSFLLEDEREGTKDRVLMGKIGEKSYYGGLCTIFFALTSIPAVEYFIVCNILGYEFGFENKVILLVLLEIIVLLAVVFNIMIASLVKKKGIANLINGGLILPVFMLSGSFWPFDMMSEGMRKIGSGLPPRWFFLALEKLQGGEAVSSIIPMVGGLIMIIVLLFALSIFFTRNKIVLAKDDQ